MSDIHASAVIDPKAELAPNVRVGPFCYVGPDVVLGEGCVLHPHATIQGPSRLGANNELYPYCTIGAAPQDLKYQGGPTELIIGDNNTFRESVTIHRGTEADLQSQGKTRVGNNNLLMVGVHVAHDCHLGNYIIIANQVQLAGHVRIEDCVTVGGASAMHHFVTVGRNAFVGGMTRVTHDVPPYMKIQGYDPQVRAVNSTGMQRWGISADSINAVKAAFKLLYARRTNRAPGRMYEALREIEQNGLVDDEHVRYLADFLRTKLEIGVFGRMRERHRRDNPKDRKAYSGSGKTE